MESSNHPSINLFDHLLKAIDSVGLKRTEEILKSVCEDQIIFDNKDVEIVVTAVASKFDIPVSEIVNGFGRKNERRMAIGFCSHYLNVVFKMQYIDIAVYLKKHLSVIQKYELSVRKLNPKHISDQRYCRIKEMLDQSFQTQSWCKRT